MQSVGTLAGGVAHEFNNLLAGIQGYAALGLREPGVRPTLREFLAVHRRPVRPGRQPDPAAAGLRPQAGPEPPADVDGTTAARHGATWSGTRLQQ